MINLDDVTDEKEKKAKNKNNKKNSNKNTHTHTDTHTHTHTHTQNRTTYLKLDAHSRSYIQNINNWNLWIRKSKQIAKSDKIIN